MEGKYSLLSSAIFSDIEWPLTHILRIHHHLAFNM